LTDCCPVWWVAEAAEYAPGAGDMEKEFVKTVLNRFVETSIEGLKDTLQPAKIQLF
jgi:hypothetical protein